MYYLIINEHLNPNKKHGLVHLIQLWQEKEDEKATVQEPPLQTDTIHRMEHKDGSSLAGFPT